MSENAARIAAYKNHSKNSQEMLRNKRHELTVELRKNKKDDQLFKRRNIGTPDDEPASPLQENNGQSPALLTMEEIVAGMQSDNPARVFECVQAARKMLSKEKNPPIDTMIGYGIVPLCVQFLENNDSPTLQFEAAWTLTNIASGDSHQTQAVVKAGAIPRFIALLNSPDPTVAEQAVWALGNIAGDGAESRDIVLNYDVVDCIMELIADQLNISFMRNIVWLISNLCRNKNPHPPFDKISPLLPLLAQLVRHFDEAIITDSCWALSYITDDDADKIQAVVDTGVVPTMVELLDSSNLTILTPALRTVGNIVTGNDQQTDAVLAAGVLPRLIRLLQHKKSAIIKEAAWTVSNITAGNHDQIQAVLNAGIISILIDVLEAGDFKSQKEAAWAITNATTGGTAEQIIFILEKHSLLKPFCDLLDSKDARLIKVILSGLENICKLAEKMGAMDNLALIIEEVGGLDKLESLQNHDNEEIYKKALSLVENYFSAESGAVQEDIAPAEENGELAFNPVSDPGAAGDGFSF